MGSEMCIRDRIKGVCWQLVVGGFVVMEETVLGLRLPRLLSAGLVVAFWLNAHPDLGSLHICRGGLSSRCRAWLVDGLCSGSRGGRRVRWLVGELCCGIIWRSRRHRGGLPRESHDRAVSTGAGSSSRRRRRRVLPTAMGHAFATSLHLLHVHVAGLHIMWYARTPV